MIIPWILCSLFLVLNVILIFKLYLMKKDLNDLSVEFRDNLKQETNSLITLSTHDLHIRKIASEINTELRQLRHQRHQYMNGDRELKEAITNISHDLRTPLTGICGYLELLEQEDDVEVIKFYIEQIQNRTECLKQLTEELFRYSVIVSSWQDTKESTTLNRALEESLLAYYGAITQKKITLTVDIPDTPMQRDIDMPAFNRIISNILSNAIKYSDGDLTVKLHTDGMISFTNSAKDLTPVIVNRLFDRFYTVETGRNSTGLGLPIAKALVERTGGQIEAVYEEGKLTILLKFL